MSSLQIFWDPAGFELDSLGRKRLTRITDAALRAFVDPDLPAPGGFPYGGGM